MPRAKEETHSADQLMKQYFKFIDNKDLEGIMDLFDYEAVVKEPFSNVKGGLKGKSAIRPFLQVAMMANSKLDRTIKVEKATENRIVAVITFERGERVKGRFDFVFADTEEGKRIKSLNIDFL
jgi:ketosteroid isomerase-like protein